MPPGRKLVVVDGYSLLFRAFFGTRYLSTSDGKPTNALFGFVGMLFNLIEAERPDAVVVALDAPGNTFRHDDFEAYKGTRRETPDELQVQLVASRDLIAALGVPTIELSGFEADDVIGTISRQAEANDYHTFIVTGDLDALQLVDPCITVVTTRQGVTDVVRYTPEAVEERYGFGPALIPDYKALVGDTSDNIPGVPGVGEKTATKLLQQFGPVENLIARIDEVEEKFRKKLLPALDQIPKSKWLATIVRDCELNYDFAPYRLTPAQFETARTALEALEFRNHLRRLPMILGPYVSGSEASAAMVEVTDERLQPTLGADLANLDEFRAFCGDRQFGFRLESATLQRSMFDDEETLVGHVAVGLEVRRVTGELAWTIFREHGARAIVHDGKPLLKRAGLPGSVGFDTALAGYVLQSGRSNYTLRDLAQAYLEVLPPETPEQLAAALALLEPVMRAKIEAEGQGRVLDEIELPLMPVLAEMEQEGIAVSEPFLREFSKSLEVEIDKTQRLIFELAGQEFLIASPKQLGEVLFERLGLPGAKKTKTGYATGAEVLGEMLEAHPIVPEVLTWRELTKLKSTYADALPKMIGPDGRIHTTFNQTVAATGRLSSNDPNLQNIPIRTELGRQIRRAFVARPGHALLSFDYSQIELRLLAHMCRDESLMRAFRDGEDVHRATAALMFGVPLGEVTKEMRGKAKLLNFAVLYGVTDYGLSAQLGVGFSQSDAKALILQYNERFPAVKAFTDSVVVEARSKGYTSTLCGRRRWFPEIHSGNRMERLYAERQAMNAPIQGSAADMIKIAMVRLADALRDTPVRMLLQVHDELLFEAPEGDLSHVSLIRSVMEEALPLDVPVVVDGKCGPNWNEMTPLTSLPGATDPMRSA